MKIEKYEVWQGGEKYNEYRTVKEAKHCAETLKRYPGTIWVNKVTIERVNI